MSELRLNQHTAKSIVAMLAQKHAEDVFVPECKDGPTWGSEHLRLDGWAMRRSWSRAMTTGYEVKVSRSDFLNDQKWPAYLPCCNAFYFVCPSGLIRPEEVGEAAGLMYVCGSRLVTKKKAPHREVEIPETLFRYILMSRSRIVGANEPGGKEDKAQFWREWLAQSDEERRLGYTVSKRIREHVEEVERENRKLKEKHKSYDDIRAVLERLGWKNADAEWLSAYSVEAKIKALHEIVPPWFAKTLEQIETASKSIREQLTAQPPTQTTLPPV